jgi:hypothetical protein
MQHRSTPPSHHPSPATLSCFHPLVEVVVVNVVVVVPCPPVPHRWPARSIPCIRPSGRETMARSSSVDVGRRRRRAPTSSCPPPSLSFQHCHPPRRQCWSTQRPPNVDVTSEVVSHNIAPPPIFAPHARRIVPPPCRPPDSHLGVVHANVEQKLLNRNILSIFLLTDLVFVMLLLCNATNFRNQSPKRSQLC